MRGSTYIHIHSESLNDIAGLEDGFRSSWAEKKNVRGSTYIHIHSKSLNDTAGLEAFLVTSDICAYTLEG